MPSRPDLSGYTYGAISSLVLTADRIVLPRRDCNKEPDSAPSPTLLADRIDPSETETQDVESSPRPEHPVAGSESFEVHEHILSSVHNAIAPSIVGSAAGTVLETLNMKDLDQKKEEIERVLRTVLSEHFSQLISLSKRRIANYDAEDDSDTMSDSDMERKDAEIEDEVRKNEEQEEGRGRGRVRE
ncbi:hypothetical protein D9615_006231 [Tricholomella constricta]|uniref:Uncharacterized protein n=1 Tax=Tricholomella constricta TaxID=117010 RepID=A0A8H5HBB1_9AGAR|nr:hypothetical protein D9615_006231 [Tricholomella constricta]